MTCYLNYISNINLINKFLGSFVNRWMRVNDLDHFFSNVHDFCFTLSKSGRAKKPSQRTAPSNLHSVVHTVIHQLFAQ